MSLIIQNTGVIFNDTRKVKVLSLPETIKEKSTFLRAKGLTPDEGPSLETSIFPLSFQVVRILYLSRIIKHTTYTGKVSWSNFCMINA